MEIFRILRNFSLVVAVFLALLAMMDFWDVRQESVNQEVAIMAIALFASLMIAPALLLAGVFQVLFLVSRRYKTRKIQRRIDPDWLGKGV